MFQLNMTDPSSQCPTGFSLTTQNGIRLCIRSNTTAGCTGINTENIGHPYTQVCGFARGYSFETPDAFSHRTSSEPLSGNYVDGISITYGILHQIIYGHMLLVLEKVENNRSIVLATLMGQIMFLHT